MVLPAIKQDLAWSAVTGGIVCRGPEPVSAEPRGARVSVSISRAVLHEDGSVKIRPTEVRTSAPHKNRNGFRADIQALRALAVALVVLGHLWPGRLTGGYVGVDVFFVISGFLITTHLSKEIFSTGQLNFAAFYSKRIRRLLPAALLVLIISLVAAVFVLPFSRWGDTALQTVASAFYVENWLLAANAVDYSASTNSATVAQHFWSLSVEEQFYLAWPLVLVAFAALAGRIGINRRTAMVYGIAAMTVGSLVLSSYLANAGRHEAYFYTPVRLWEFGIGAGLALIAPRIRLNGLTANVASIVGLIAIAGSGIAFNPQTPFPGTAALVPVVGTAMVIAGGMRREPQWLSRATSLPAVQFVGNISYSLYLWHWPLIVLGPFALGAELQTPSKVLLLIVSVLLAWGTKLWVEDKGIQFKPKSRPALKTIAWMLVSMAVIAAAGAGVGQAQQARAAEAERITFEQRSSPCYGPRAMDRPEDCDDKFGKPLVSTMSDANNYYSTPSECGDHQDILLVGDKKTTKFCDFSKGAENPTTVWLVGDSHAQQWQAPMLDLAKSNKWILKISYLGGCPPAAVSYMGYGSAGDETSINECRSWSRAMVATVAADQPEYVFTSSFARNELVDDGSGRSPTEQYAEGFRAVWDTWTVGGSRVVVLADPPLNVDVRSADCVQLHVDNPAECAVARRIAAPEDPMVSAARTYESESLTLVDLTDYFCDSNSCYGAIGGVVVYYDANHLNKEFSRLLRPMIEAQL